MSTRIQNGVLHALALLLALLALVPATARAGGIEYAGQGARGLARGGATKAKAEDVQVLMNNPAGLAEIRGTMLQADFQVALMDACVDPIGYYGWGVYRGGSPAEFTDPKTGEVTKLNLGQLYSEGGEQQYYTEKLDTVCLNHMPTPIPQAAWATRVNDWFGIGFGVMFPSVTPQGNWGNAKDGVIRGASGELRPSPLRYMKISSGNIGVFPTLGVGFKLFQQLRLGATFQWGIFSIHQRQMAASGGGTSPAADVIAEIRAVDWFVPSLTASAHIVPMDALDIVVAFKWQDKVKAPGEMEVTTGVFAPDFNTHTTRGITVDRAEQALPHKLSVGVRYADRLAPRPRDDGDSEADEANDSRLRDPMSEERWDIEADLDYTINQQIHDTQLAPTPNQNIEFEAPDGTISKIQFPSTNLPVNVIERNWKNQIGVQLGGSYNIVPGVFSLHGGVNFETRGVDAQYMNVDFWPLRRYGVHGGVTLRIDRRIDLTLAYGHIFQETLHVAAPPHQDRLEETAEGGVNKGIDKTVGTPQDRTGAGTIVANEPKQAQAPDATANLEQELTATAAGDPAYVINSGNYRSNLDVVSVGIQLHF